MIIHLLRDASAFLEALLLLGADPKEVFIVGKPYSTLKQTVSESRKSGFKNIWTPSNMQDFKRSVREALELAMSNGKRVSIIEDGGYCLDLIGKFMMANVLGIVEQTTIGIKRDEKVLKKSKFSFPIINVAESSSKKKLESEMVGLAIRRNIENILIRYNKSLPGQTVLVVGFGSIGSAVAAALRDSCVVHVFDKSALSRIDARQNGYTVRGLSRGLEEADIIIGCSGQLWAKEKELLRLKHGAIFVCASSERVEYSHPTLEKHCLKSPRNIKGVGLGFTLTNRKSLILLAEGYPVNFYGTTKDSVPMSSFQIVSALLLWGLLLLTTPLPSVSILRFPEKDEKKIVETYERIRWSPVI